MAEEMDPIIKTTFENIFKIAAIAEEKRNKKGQYDEALCKKVSEAVQKFVQASVMPGKVDDELNDLQKKLKDLPKNEEALRCAIGAAKGATILILLLQGFLQFCYEFLNQPEVADQVTQMADQLLKNQTNPYS